MSSDQTAPTPPPLSNATVLRSGQTVDGRYRVGRLIAKGGMAEVWLGEVIHLHKAVALKVISRSFAARGGAQELLRRESLAAGKINHPNVLTVFDVVDHQGMSCIVMEYLQGESLADYLLRHGALSLREAARLLVPAMRGVAAAHAQGIVHRDLKPANIFLCHDNDGSVITSKVLDFGISKVKDCSQTVDSAPINLSHFGTPAYMAPEDLMGSATVDERADVYAFGAVLFEALTGRRLFPGEQDLVLINTILNERPPRLSKFRPDLPHDVDAAIDCALAKAPQDRYSSMARLIQALERYALTTTEIAHDAISSALRSSLVTTKRSARKPAASFGRGLLSKGPLALATAAFLGGSFLAWSPSATRSQPKSPEQSLSAPTVTALAVPQLEAPPREEETHPPAKAPSALEKDTTEPREERVRQGRSQRHVHHAKERYNNPFEEPSENPGSRRGSRRHR